jgi:hypothetical protein
MVGFGTELAHLGGERIGGVREVVTELAQERKGRGTVAWPFDWVGE